MSVIDTSGWGDFVIEEVFDIHSTISGIDKNKLNHAVGDIPYITRSEDNNAITQYVTEDQDSRYQLEKGGVITVGLDTQTVHYQPNAFFTGQNVHTVDHPRFNECVALFVVPCIKAVLRKYDWANGATLGRIRKEVIKLPITSTGEPDWQYMEDVMRDELKKQESKLDSLIALNARQAAQIDTYKWEQFRVGDLFDIHPTSAYKANNRQL
ncbi:restriction endonuclease subunit S [Corynebacterium sp. KPL2734]|uniref:restriction endonuclease subunit S n=1 Tax=Corynebacterium sp. KPL2734 TaxID=3158312 RepID=UPI0032EEE059